MSDTQPELHDWVCPACVHRDHDRCGIHCPSCLSPCLCVCRRWRIPIQPKAVEKA